MGKLKIAYSEKKVTPWGEMKLLKGFIIKNYVKIQAQMERE